MAGRDPRTSSVRNDRAAAGLEEDRARVLELQGRVSQLRASPKIPAEITDRLDEMASVLEWFRARAEQESNKSDGVRLDELRRGRDALALESERAELDAAQALLDVLADEVQATPVLGEDVRLAACTIEGARPQVLALEDVDVAMVTLDGLDMSRCRFAGTPNLDKARIDGTFPRSPATLRWSKRLVIAEERAWRVKRGHNAWRRPESGPPGDAEPFYTHGNVPPDASQLAEIYRALRKGREDAKDEPGAADFYYGEMEMRRHSRGRTQTRSGDFGERTVLWLYWLVSGYGLRASRALAALALTILVFALALWGFGLKNSDFSSALLQSIQGAAFRGGDKDVLTEAGQYIQIPLRLLGPLFFGLALLSLRGRVKR
jgi:hypothetical protein